MKKIISIFVFGLFACSAWAQSTDFYYFADSVVDIFADIRDAQFLPDLKINAEGRALLENALNKSVRKDKVYTRVLYRLKQFNKQDHKEIQQAVAILSSGIGMLQLANNMGGEYMEKLLNDPKQLLQQGTVSRKTAEISEFAEGSWKVYSQTAGRSEERRVGKEC